MGDDLRGAKRLRSQPQELTREAERGFVVAERACGAMVTDFEVKEIEDENANVWGNEIREKAGALEKSHERGSCSAIESTHEEPVNCREMMRRPEEERRKWEAGMDKEFKDFE